MTIKKSFKKYFSNSNTEAKIAKYKETSANDELSDKLWKWLERFGVLIQFLESLILAQDERWRRA